MTLRDGGKWVRLRQACWLAGMVGFALVGASVEALADGAFAFKMGLVQQDIRGPEQKAVIVYREGKETLILSVKYAGAVADFAWVVPVPSRPKVEKGDPKIFEELAELTAPEVKYAEGIAGMKGKGALEGVEVLERKQVGVYDVAVLAATDEAALADWLKNNGYALPGNAEPVLRHYVQKGWFYVAMRIDPKKVEEELVKELEQVDARIDSLRRGEEVGPMMAEEDVEGGRPYEASRVRRVTHILEDFKKTGGDLNSHVGSLYGYYLRPGPNQLDVSRVVGGLLKEARRELEQRGLRGEKLEEVLLSPLRKLEPRIRSVVDVGEVVRKVARDDAKAGRTYASSRLKEMVDALLPLIAGPEVKSHTGWAAQAYEAVVETRKQLRETMSQMFRDALGSVEDSLREGTLHPVSLSFSCQDPVYPLRMTSLNPGETKILLYVFAERRTKAEGFRVRWAQRASETLPRRALGEFLAASWYGEGEAKGPFLTKLEGEFAPEEMKDDLRIQYARWSRPYREVVSGKPAPPAGRPAPHGIIPGVVALPLLGFLVGVLVTLVVSRRRRG